MDNVATPRKSRLARAFKKILHVRATTGALENGVQKLKINTTKSKKVDRFDEENDSALDDAQAREAFLAKVFAGLSSVKAAYAQLQFAQNPYDSQGIQSADSDIVSELKVLSELKQGYLKKNLDEKANVPLGTTLMLSEVREQKSLIKTYEITAKKLDSDLRLKDSEITFLKEKLAEINAENQLLESRLSSIEERLNFPNCARLSDLRPSHFISQFRVAVKSMRSFVRLLITEVESVGWDLEAAAASIVPGTAFWKSSHIGYAFESFVSKHMFDGFNSINNRNRRDSSFDRFVELRSASPGDYLAWKPKSAFAQFCRDRYSRVVHPKLEGSIFGNFDQRMMVTSSGAFPETPFFHAFAEMAMHVWLLRCLGQCFDPTFEIFQVKRGNRFNEVYMESLSDEAFNAYDEDPRSGPCVAFVVVPGFKVGGIIVQCQVYLR